MENNKSEMNTIFQNNSIFIKDNNNEDQSSLKNENLILKKQIEDRTKDKDFKNARNILEEKRILLDE